MLKLMGKKIFTILRIKILNSPTISNFLLSGLMPYNFICVQTGSMLSEITSLDDVFTKEVLFKLFGIAAVALLPGLIINKLKEGRIKSS